jgi:hypothetical protein
MKGMRENVQFGLHLGCNPFHVGVADNASPPRHTPPSMRRGGGGLALSLLHNADVA